MMIISMSFPRESNERRMLLSYSLIIMIPYIVFAIPEQFRNGIHKKVTLPILEMPPSISWRLGSKQMVGKKAERRSAGEGEFWTKIH